MCLVRGSIGEVARDRAVTDALAGLASETGESVIRTWTPPRQVAFGRRDTTADGYTHARQIAVERGYEPVERAVGGSAVAYTGCTVAFAHAIPLNGGRDGIDSRYREATDSLLDALDDLGATVSHGEPDRSFCPGEHSVQGGGKIAGIAQRIRKRSALVGGCVIVRASDTSAIADVLDPIYAALDLPFDPNSVGSVSTAGGPDDPEAVTRAIEAAFAPTPDPPVIAATELTDYDGP
ncbi:MAG: lipoate--protein ligase family protein [Natronomonas sp.]|uniref:lipoyl protein ligase domain-containing protein n=1 Tax=Natronomonas sp. TaxID=2184060 RepID=UPI0028703399|nr:lipoate--protein ligase family protein [Natronomonas sp.]MDR9430126.1 lipoate--protein ligase family protein [Natronomonas sp.]